ncbi:DoxX family protein [Vitreoscilla massiliensis]|uniref:DoxX family protein n=1 Tax=Vitreoscilla massiliensis TaxID=1689272 RepID=A0ABY4E6C4_9NEIS|nr:DoxX family protein [Vitreoscilla massiliensis]UOO91019.1 DoxX family protein [Vitreoscilla massiliensis]
MSTNNQLTQYQPYALGLLRIVTGYMFIMHGMTKLFQIPYIEMFANVPLGSMFGAAGIIELIGGALIILGLFTRPVAFILSGQMAAAYFIGHVADGGNFLMPILNSGELAVQWCFTFLFFFVAGSGAFALDNLRNKA